LNNVNVLLLDTVMEDMLQFYTEVGCSKNVLFNMLTEFKLDTIENMEVFNAVCSEGGMYLESDNVDVVLSRKDTVMCQGAVCRNKPALVTGCVPAVCCVDDSSTRVCSYSTTRSCLQLYNSRCYMGSTRSHRTSWRVGRNFEPPVYYVDLVL